MIVGAGLVGLSAAIALRTHGVDVRVVEKHAGTSIQPKARRFNFRTMEVFRSWGVATAVAEAARDLAEFQGMRAGPTMREAELLPTPPHVDLGSLADLSPEQSCLVAQDLLEPVLLGLARERGAQVGFNTRAVGVDPDRDGVRVALAGGVTVHADYLVAADGARSTVRTLLDIPTSGNGSLGRAVSVYFDADLSELVRGREFNLCQVENPSAPGALASIDGARRWLFYTGELLPLNDPGWPDLIRLAIGADVPVTIRSVQAWEPTVSVTDRYVVGRILFAGDAAHVMPPYAALGANTGIQDVANAAWKLAAVLRGDASPALVETYHAERHAAGAFAATQSALRSGSLRELATGHGGAAHPLALVAGFQYPHGALIPDGSGPQPMDQLDLTGRPGTRVPHAWLPDGRSTLDLPANRFALLGGGEPHRRAAHAAGIASAAVSGWTEALLVRPDQIVAWRATRPGDLAAVLTRVGGKPQDGC